MVLTLLLSTCSTVFLAELGDKTQLATFALSGATNKPLAVFLGSSFALVLSSLLGALAGGSIAPILPERILECIAAIIFCYLGISLIVRSFSIKQDLNKL
tara:strand:+ start:14484 stop:14783 length:300 start_codon:yes stop_codon:yes gene_type:complete